METRVCKNCQANFEITPDDFSFYEKIKVPSPTWCPECRMQRRMVWRNERKLYRVPDAFTGKQILSLTPPDTGIEQQVTDDEWRSDSWDPADYGREVDFLRPFLVQVGDLLHEVPKATRSVLNMVNSEYSANAGDLKNCYLCFNSNWSEDSAYANGMDFSKNCFDNSHIQKCELCYNSFWLTNCYRTHFSSRSEDCSESWFLKDCRGCTNCMGCVNLRQKSYCIFNEQYSKEEYEKRLKEFRLDTWNGLQIFQKQAHEFWLKFPNKYLQGVQNKDVSGEFITNSKNVHKSYIMRECEDCNRVQYSQVPKSKNCYDCTLIGANSDLFYESSVCGWGGARLQFCVECWDNVHDIEYSMFCRSSSYLFGCVGMKNKQYCILNKQYTKEEYENLVGKIKKHMTEMPYKDTRGREYPYGEFFPAELSPLYYNHTITIEHFPLTETEAKVQGFRWSTESPTEYQTTMQASDLPDAIAEVSEDILKEVIKCAHCNRAYRLIAPELQFLKRMGIPVPRHCVDCRHQARIAQRNSAHFYHRSCAKCGKDIETSYSPDRPEIVYCESCYQAEVM